MAEIKKLREKYQWYVIIILFILLLIFFFAKKINLNKFLVLILIITAAFFFLYKKSSKMDIYAAARKIQLLHFKNTGELLDMENLQATEMPIGSGRLLLEFKSNSRVFEFQDNLVLGSQIRELYNVRSDMEKSRLVEQVSKQQTLKEQLKEGAKKLGLDAEGLGLE